jgi:hypothetical protein
MTRGRAPAANLNRRGPPTEKLVKRTRKQVETATPTRRRTRAETGLPITPQQRQFVTEYLKDYDIVAAGKRAGYKSDDVTVIRAFAAIGPFIREAQLAKAREIGRRSYTSQELVLGQMAAEAHYSEMEFVVIEEVPDPVDRGKKVTIRRQKRLEELTPDQQMIIKDIRFFPDGNASYSLPNRMQARTLIGKHLGMFNDKLIMEHRHRQLSGRPNLENVPDEILDKTEAMLLKYMGPKGLRLIGEYQHRDENEFDATQQGK